MTQRQYVAGKRLKIGHGYREIGEPVPEAAGWRHLESYINAGSIKITEVPNRFEELKDSLSETTLKELRQIAAHLEIKNRGKMKKDALVRAILDAEIAKGAQEEE